MGNAMACMRTPFHKPRLHSAPDKPGSASRRIMVLRIPADQMSEPTRVNFSPAPLADARWTARSSCAGPAVLLKCCIHCGRVIRSCARAAGGSYLSFLRDEQVVPLIHAQEECLLDKCDQSSSPFRMYPSPAASSVLS